MTQFVCTGCGREVSGLPAPPPDWVRMTVEAGGTEETIRACGTCASTVADLFAMTLNGLKRIGAHGH